MSESELALWAEFYQVEPWGEARADLRSGIIASTVANGYARKGTKPSDFMPFLQKPKPAEMSEDDIEAAINSLRGYCGS